MRNTLLAIAVFVLVTGCSQTYYSFWNKLGYEKRDILVDKVEEARDAQNKAKEEFKTTFQKFKELTSYEGGELEKKYDKLSSSYESCKERADKVKGRVNAVDQTANDLFKEWEQELGKYENQEMRRSSEKKLAETKSRYKELITAMRNSEVKMDPVLRAFQDQVLFLKHNLNAQAIASLQTTAAGIENDVQALIREMEASINEANEFINQIKQEK